jgi:hypothetical protein
MCNNYLLRLVIYMKLSKNETGQAILNYNNPLLITEKMK